MFTLLVLEELWAGSKLLGYVMPFPLFNRHQVSLLPDLFLPYMLPFLVRAN